MRAIVQRVSSASVDVDSVRVADCQTGLLLLVGVHRDDTEEDARRLADKIVGLRIFNDEQGKINLALNQLGGPDRPTVLAVSNFTVYGDASKGRRPNFLASAPFETGKALFGWFVEELAALGAVVKLGEYGAHMSVSLVNEGPVTLIVETR